MKCKIEFPASQIGLYVVVVVVVLVVVVVVVVQCSITTNYRSVLKSAIVPSLSRQAAAATGAVCKHNVSSHSHRQAPSSNLRNAQRMVDANGR